MAGGTFSSPGHDSAVLPAAKRTMYVGHCVSFRSLASDLVFTDRNVLLASGPATRLIVSKAVSSRLSEEREKSSYICIKSESNDYVISSMISQKKRKK